jgi:hypothetical protein
VKAEPVTRLATAPTIIELNAAVSCVGPEQVEKSFSAEVASSGHEDLVALRRSSGPS